MTSNPNALPNQIWIIDDDSSIRWVLEKTLNQAGYEVTAFESGSNALSQFKRTAVNQRPELILTDVRMPGINGFELLKQIKHISPSTPIIVMTAYSDLESTQRGFEDGAFEYLPKPFDIDHALKLIDAAINLNNAESTDQLLAEPSDDWQAPLRHWARQKLSNGEHNILKTGSKIFERTLLECALEVTRGRKQDAARRLGWGRNTLTRKLKEFDF